jgi:hypothetical protein
MKKAWKKASIFLLFTLVFISDLKCGTLIYQSAHTQLDAIPLVFLVRLLAKSFPEGPKHRTKGALGKEGRRCGNWTGRGV